MTNPELLVTLMAKHANHSLDIVEVAGMKLFADRLNTSGILDDDNRYMCRAIGRALVEYADVKEGNRKGLSINNIP